MMVTELEERLFDQMCSEFSEQALWSEGETVVLKRKIETWIRNAEAFKDLSTLEKKAQAVNWFHRLTGYDFLEEFLLDPDVTEIMINGPAGLFIERGNAMASVPMRFSEERLRQLIQKMVAEVDRRVNYRSPIVDARLSGGARLNVVMQPVGLEGPYVTIRKFRRDLLTLEALRDRGMMNEALLRFLRGAVQTRQNLMISGGTSSGKTTLLNCLCQCIPSTQRVISIEDSAELNLSSIKNLVRLETRQASPGDGLEITVSDLIRAALRMRPDRMIIGEIRGMEALDMLQAMNTGHDGSMSTGHSNGARDMLDRIEAMAMMARHTTSEGVRRQMGSGIHWVIHLKKLGDGRRVIQEIIRVAGCGSQGVEVEPIVAAEFEVVNAKRFAALEAYGQAST